jgi:hypothetical protein
MSSFYSNLAQEDTKKEKEEEEERERVKNAIVLKKSPKKPTKGPKSPILKKRL